MKSKVFLSVVLLTVVLGLPQLARADGMLVPREPIYPAFSVVYHRVDVKIDRQVATTDIDQAFRAHWWREPIPLREDRLIYPPPPRPIPARPIEGTYIFPLYDNIALSKFSMYVGGEELPHRVLPKEEARRIYNDIVRVRQDPALLEWVGTRMIQARVYPIQPHEDKRIRVAYQEVLKASGGVVKYVYPLKTEKVSARPLDEVSVNIEIRSPQPIRSVYSPTHPVTVRREGDHRAFVSYRDRNARPDQDLVLYYTVSEKDLGLDLLTYNDRRGDGYFLLLAAPKAELRRDEVQAKDVVFVLDTSGSMAGDGKMEQAKAAMKFCVNNLDSRDRFNVVAFSTDIRPWRSGLQSATRENVRDAEEFIAQFKAQGGTNIHESLRAALEMLNDTPSVSPPSQGGEGGGMRPPVLIFMTDGLPTVGETNNERILAMVKDLNRRRVRVFDFGVGYDVNTHFLDRLAEQNNGYAENVLPKEDIEVKVSDFYAKVSTPLMMNVRMDWGKADVYDLYPREMPDLFKGSQLIVLGRYRTRGEGIHTAIRLSGDVNGRRETFTYDVTFPHSAFADDFIPRLWATRKIGYLEDEVRLRGPNREVIEEIIRLSKEHGILTEYTSFLVDLDVRAPRLSFGPAGPPGAPGRPHVLAKSDRELAEEGARGVDRYRQQEALGGAGGGSGVSQSVNRKAAKDAMQMPGFGGNVIMTERGDKVQLGQMKNVSQRSFVQAGRQWVDVNYKDSQKLVKVKAFSPAYFQLANAHPRMAQYMSVSDDVIIVLKDVALHVNKNSGQETEFSAAEFKDFKAKMEMEFGVQPAVGSEKRTAMTGTDTIQVTTTVRARVPRLAWLLVLPAMVAVGVWVRKLVNESMSQ
jgi:Ca-activated chloride channel family protein